MNFETVTPQAFLAKWQQTDLPVLDVRSPEEYQNGHIPNAENLPLERLPQVLDQLDQALTYYVICRSGRRSEQASQFLTEQGYHVINVAEGMNAWTGPLVK